MASLLPNHRRALHRLPKHRRNLVLHIRTTRHKTNKASSRTLSTSSKPSSATAAGSDCTILKLLVSNLHLAKDIDHVDAAIIPFTSSLTEEDESEAHQSSVWRHVSELSSPRSTSPAPQPRRPSMPSLLPDQSSTVHTRPRPTCTWKNSINGL